MTPPPPDRDVELALAVVGYQWAVHGDDYLFTDPINAIDVLRTAAGRYPGDARPLAEIYPHVARLAALSLKVLAALGDPGDVDGLKGFEGFDYWRESR